MRAELGWLSLKVSQRVPQKKAILYSIPKKIVPRAVTRNRIKRLIREATRNDSFFSDPKKSFFFRVLATPKAPNLRDTLAAIEKLK